MKELDDYIDRAKEEEGIPSDRALSLRLGRDPTTVCQWRTDDKLPGDDSMRQLAEMAKRDPLEALIRLNMWRQTSKETRNVYARFFETTRKTTTGLAVGAAVLTAPAQAQDLAVAREGLVLARTVNEVTWQFPQLYIMRFWRWLKKAIKLRAIPAERAIAA